MKEKRIKVLEVKRLTKNGNNDSDDETVKHKDTHGHTKTKKYTIMYDSQVVI